MLRDYQVKQNAAIVNSLSFGNRFVLSVMPTGAGKTVCMSSIFQNHSGYSLAIAHRQELVSQISLALARCGVYHNIIAPASIIKFISILHIRETGQNFYDQNARLAVAGVDTLLRREISNAGQVSLVQIDEAHHVLNDNKWGRAMLMFPNAKGIGWTATPCRSDKRTLTYGYDGIFQDLILGPTMRDLIDCGFLCDYKIIGPPNPIDLSQVKISKATGDFNSVQLRDAAHRSQITGDIISHYLRFAAGKRGVVFAVDVELAKEYAEAFNQAGIPAGTVSAKTPDAERMELIDKLRNGELRVLTNVDIFGEGFDLPAIEVVSMARPTQSYGLYVQQFGRALRTMPGKQRGILIDHVGNTARHGGPPDTRDDWFLETPERRQVLPRETPIRTCVNPECFRVFESWSPRCPYCGDMPEPAERDRPEHVEGDLTEYSPELLDQLRRKSDRLAGEPPFSIRDGITAIQDEHWRARAEAHRNLKDALAWWGGVQRDLRRIDDSTAYRKFWHRFGIDVSSAQALEKKKDVDELCRRIWDDIETETRGTI